MKKIIKKSSIRKVKFGKNVKIVSPVNLYDCVIGDNVFIGPFVEIQKMLKLEMIVEYNLIHLYAKTLLSEIMYL